MYSWEFWAFGILNLFLGVVLGSIITMAYTIRRIGE
jgi:hypothetical protein